jgi:hypothetical protein
VAAHQFIVLQDANAPLEHLECAQKSAIYRERKNINVNPLKCIEFSEILLPIVKKAFNFYFVIHFDELLVQRIQYIKY